MYHQVLNHGLLMYLQNNLLKEHLLEKTMSLRKYLGKLVSTPKILGIKYSQMADQCRTSKNLMDGFTITEEDLPKKMTGKW